MEICNGLDLTVIRNQLYSLSAVNANYLISTCEALKCMTSTLDPFE
jgi:hypothetical protein